MRVSAVYYIKMQDDASYASLQTAISNTVKENDALMALVASNSELKALATHVSDAIDEYTNQGKIYHDAVQSGNTAKAAVAENASNVVGSTDKTSKSFGGAAQIEALSQEALNAKQSSARTLQIILMAVSTFGGLLAAMVIMNSITKPLGKIVKAGDSLAIGDLENANIDINSKDEVGVVANSFRNIVASQKELAGSQTSITASSVPERIEPVAPPVRA
jgi:methyl-accepting chemotaxis protein